MSLNVLNSKVNNSFGSHTYHSIRSKRTQKVNLSEQMGFLTSQCFSADRPSKGLLKKTNIYNAEKAPC